jgi:hypothetical protein
MASVQNRRDDLLDVLDRDLIDVEIGEPLRVCEQRALPACE